MIIPPSRCNLFSQNSAFDFRNNGFVISEIIISWQYSNQMPFVIHTYSTEFRGWRGKGGMGDAWHIRVKKFERRFEGQ